MCKVFKTATFKKVFTPIISNGSLLYSDLPEKTVTQKIYKLRKLSGLTQREFAAVCCIGYSSVCKYELGSKPSSKNLKKICIAFNLKSKYFNQQV